MRAPFHVILAAMIAFLAGCTPPKDDGPPPIERGAPPALADIASRYNARVEKLDRLRSPISVAIKTLDADHKPVSEQADGHFQYIRPAKLALRIDKVGKTIFYLGGDDERFWWLDLTRDPKAALIGSHDRVTREQAAGVGLPVHPLDLLQILGVYPLTRETTDPRWADHGHTLRIDQPGRWGMTRIYLDPTSYEPVRIELGPEPGPPAVSAVLKNYAPVEVDQDAFAPARIATLVEIEMPASQTSVRLRIYEPENPGTRLKPQAFNLDLLLDTYGVERVLNLDERKNP